MAHIEHEFAGTVGGIAEVATCIRVLYGFDLSIQLWPLLGSCLKDGATSRQIIFAFALLLHDAPEQSVEQFNICIQAKLVAALEFIKNTDANLSDDELRIRWQVLRDGDVSEAALRTSQWKIAFNAFNAVRHGQPSSIN
jgi:hypothetical protein